MISVIVPVYNGSLFLDDFLDSFERQSCCDFEILFVDDGSTDDTYEKIQSACKSKALSIKLIRQKNGGVSAARNAGLASATGEYVCFVDVDDRVCADYLNLLLNALVEADSGIAIGYITRTGKTISRGTEPTVVVLERDDMLREYLYRGSRYSLCSCLIEKALLDGYGLSFVEGAHYSEDVHLLWRLLARVDRVAVVRNSIYNYVNNPLSAMNKVDLRRAGAIELMKELECYMEEFAPAFSDEYCKYVVARHHWSILWQAAAVSPTASQFKDYHKNFSMKIQLQKLFDYPEFIVSTTSRIFCLSEAVYYGLVRFYVKLLR